jgi:hypothetical protein
MKPSKKRRYSQPYIAAYLGRPATNFSSWEKKGKKCVSFTVPYSTIKKHGRKINRPEKKGRGYSQP